MDDINRRKLLKATAGGVTVGPATLLAGCSGDAQTGVGDTDTDAGDDTTDEGSDETTDSSDSFNLRLLLNHEFDQFNHNTGWMAPPSRDIYQNLVDRDYDMKLQPGMLSDWTFENDNQDIVFDLREGITFHDGSSFDAEHVKWFMTDYLLNGDGTGYMVDGIVDDVLVEDTYTARVKLANPAPNLLWNLSSAYAGVPSREAIEKHGDDYGRSIAVGSGPYQWKSRDGDRHLVLERYEDYDWSPEWIGLEGAGRAQQITYDVITETSSRTAALETGEADVILTGLPSTKVKPYENNSDVKVHRGDGRQVRWLGFNLNPEKGDVIAEDLNLRKAISYAIDRQSIVDGLFQGLGKPGVNLLPPTVSAQDIEDKYNHSFDLEKAKSLMEDAGWTVTPGGVSTKDGEEASFELLTTNASTARNLATVYQEQASKIGVELNPKVVDEATVQSRIKDGNFETIVEGYTWQNADILDWFFAFDMKPYPAWFGVQEDREADTRANELIEAGMSAGSWEDRIQKFKEANAYLMENVVPAAPVHYPEAISAARADLEGYKFYTLGTTVETISK
ncbi:ABC transporter substrate-binding protein [Halorubrum halophilum]|uniref:ABC transporter substrate-binding protein n=1 Tax=Halorubrum halophilum TaxID=413816 RepID=UPI001D013AAD|nr:ABC transporter substrate-binding protein [Halorubrum halophilum]